MSKSIVFKNIAYLGLMQAANYIFPLISIPIISRIIGPDKYGAINYSFSFVSYFTLFIAFGFDLSATRQISAAPGDKQLRSKIFSQVFTAQLLLLLISLVIFCVCIFSIPPLANEKKVACYTFIFCFSTVLTQNWLFQAMQDLGKVAIFNFIGKLLFTVAVLIMVRQKEDYVWQPLILSLSQIAVAGLSFYWAYKKYEIRFVSVSLREILQLLWREKTVFFSMVVISLYTTTNTVMLGFFANQMQVGYYTAAQRLMAVVTSVINFPLAQALYPFIGSCLAESREKGIKAVQKILPVIILITGFVGVLLLFVAPALISAFYGPSFTPAIVPLKIMAFIPLIVSLSNVFGIQLMLNLKMDKLFFWVTFLGGIFGLCLNYIMIGYMGYAGTAWNWLIVEIYITAIMYFVLLKKGINTIDLNQFKIQSIKVAAQPIIRKILRSK